MGAMSNLQLYIAVGLPTLAVITSLVISLVQISAIREDMRTQMAAIREEMHAQNTAIREDMHSQIGAIREEIREIREDIREIRADIKLLTGKVYELMSQK
jgi:chromosome segregation ATPase